LQLRYNTLPTQSSCWALHSPEPERRDLSPAAVPRVVRLSYAMASRSSHLQLGQCIAPQQNTEEHYSTRDFKKSYVTRGRRESEDEALSFPPLCISLSSRSLCIRASAKCHERMKVDEVELDRLVGHLFTFPEIYVYSTQYTAATGIAGLPEFSAVSFLYGKQIDYYDSNCHTLLPRQEWAKRVLGDPYWQRTARLRYSESLQLVNGLRSAMESSGHKEGVHTFQRLYGCLWDKDTGHSDGFDVYGYDGGNFLSLDLENKSFTAFVPQAKSVAQEWNRNRTQLESLHRYYKHECVAWLKTMFDDSGPHGYLKTGQYGLLQAIVLPIMTLHLKRSFPPAVLCHVTGLSTSTVEMSWERNEKEVDDYVMIGKTLPSGDGKFQKTIYLFAESEDLMKNEYRCVLTFKTLKGKTIASMNQQLHLIYGTE
ncbi:hypothetical protein NFI96_020233, partial [Prochilodus magdalenae]